ncbi:hypothetical protein MICAH_5360010 [Microcystis aeruginosa PCC 9809]|uniref:Uncharacterized protein n=1 Tax=Microcystis aeruginosa PCC 9809 TaxID=1160285 RepID=I4I3L7_MICAE|nr:hypothetical protein MICAH_5360010 [Microcystis aeruginosa PCC 9809]
MALTLICIWERTTPNAYSLLGFTIIQPNPQLQGDYSFNCQHQDFQAWGTFRMV